MKLTSHVLSPAVLSRINGHLPARRRRCFDPDQEACENRPKVMRLAHWTKKYILIFSDLGIFSAHTDRNLRENRPLDLCQGDSDSSPYLFIDPPAKEAMMDYKSYFTFYISTHQHQLKTEIMLLQNSMPYKWAQQNPQSALFKDFKKPSKNYKM